ncbi:MAG: hypothetical protein ACO1N3_04300 [Gammaproteobacteria bacterium]
MNKKLKAYLSGALLISLSLTAHAASQPRLIHRDKLNTTIDEFKHELRSCRTHIEKIMQEKPLNLQELQTVRIKCRIKLERQLGTMLISLADIGTALDAEIAEMAPTAKTTTHHKH